MTTRTDFQSVMDLKKKYIPEQRGILSTAEASLIQRVLELPQRSDIELQNIRDMVVILYGQWSDTMRQEYESTQAKETFAASMQLMDAMSAITYAIDNEKYKRGMEV